MARLCMFILVFLGCEPRPSVAVDPVVTDSTVADAVDIASAPESADVAVRPEPRILASLQPKHPRDLYDWSRAPYAIGWDAEGTAYPMYDEKPRLTTEVKERTMDIHRFVARSGLGLKQEDPMLWRFLATRASIETSGQGSQRPFDNRGVVHSLDLHAAYRAGIRLRHTYVEAGNPLAKSRPEIFLGYGPQGQNSWLFLDDWDDQGDPRMLADTVISDLTYVRVMHKKFSGLTNGRITCPEWDDTGALMKTSFNGKRYRVGRWAVNESEYDTCVDEGVQRRTNGKTETDAQSVKRCRRAHRKSYQWRPGLPTPETSGPVPIMDWWELKRASGGKPCPPWRGDEYEAHLLANFIRHARRYGFESLYRKRVRERDLGKETLDDQYELWRSIWTDAVRELDGEELDWASLEGVQIRSVAVEGPSPEKLAEQRLLERDPLALQKQHRAQ